MKKKLSGKEYAELINEVRGTILTVCIALESNIDLYISEQFCSTNDKINELASLIITPRISWNEKLEIFKMLVTKYHPDFKKNHPKFHDTIKTIIEHRNVFAHLPAALSEYGLKEYNTNRHLIFFRFKSYSDKETKEMIHSKIPFYTEAHIEEIINGCNVYIKEIRGLLRSVN